LRYTSAIPPIPISPIRIVALLVYFTVGSLRMYHEADADVKVS
jgi:hypothetical protein